MTVFFFSHKNATSYEISAKSRAGFRFGSRVPFPGFRGSSGKVPGKDWGIVSTIWRKGELVMTLFEA